MDSLQRFVALDQQTSARLAIPREARLLRLLALAVAHSGDSPLWLVGAMAALLWGNGIWRAFGWRVLIGTLAAGTITTLFKWIFRRQRPPEHGAGRGFYTRFDRHAFPSGHAGRSACLLILLASFLSPWGSVLLAFWVGLVGLARVLLQVHFVSDILGGWVVGLLTGIVLLAF
jgi:undecaprenyl-diphosphatase